MAAFVAGAVGCEGCGGSVVVALVGGWNCLIAGGGVNWSWWGCDLVAVHEIDDYWGAVSIVGLDGDFLLVHASVIDGGWLDTVEKVGGGFC